MNADASPPLGLSGVRTWSRPSAQPLAAAGRPGSGQFIRNIWYAALWSSELPAGKLVSQMITGTPVLFFRKEDGSAAAITDRCSHHFVPLSMGQIMPGDRVQCPYHGLEFNAQGRCVKNPHGDGTIPAAAHLQSFPVVEKHTVIWIWMGNKPATPETIPNYSCLDNAPELHATAPAYLYMNAGYELLTDNLLDLSHTSYLHSGILGNADTVVADISVVQEGDTVTVARPSRDAENPGILKMMLPEPMDRGDQYSTIRWSPPGCLLLEFGCSPVGQPKETGTGYFAIHFITPETDRTTHYRFSAVRWHVMTTSPELNAQIREKIAQTRKFAFSEQDLPVIEAQQRRIDEAGTPLTPVLLPIDAGPVRYQRILKRLLDADNAAEKR